MRRPGHGIGEKVRLPTSFVFNLIEIRAEGKCPATEALMIPIGKLIQEKLAEKGRTVSWLAREIPCTRANLYKIFKKDNLDTAILYRISTVLDFDFFSYYSDGLKE